MEKQEFIENCPSFERLNNAINELRNSMTAVKAELQGNNEDEKKDIIMDYLVEKL
jgi:hypothetical protein